jgi:hypothetical protein
MIVLDFWSTSCKGCIASWPKLLSIQEKFKGQVQIILTNPWETKERIIKTIDHWHTITNLIMNLPIQCHDTTLLQYFRVSGIPELVWLDKNRKLVAVTASESANESNVEELLRGKTSNIVQLIQNDDMISPTDRDKPIFVDHNGGNLLKLYWQSTFAKGEPRLRYETTAITSPTGGYFIFANACIRDLYRFAFSDRRTAEGPFQQPGRVDELLLNRIDFQVKDTSPYVNYINGEFIYDKSYAYQLLAPPTTMEKLLARMQQDLQTVIGLSARWEKKLMKCLVITTKDTSLISYKAGKTLFTIDESDFKVNNVSIPYCIDRLENEIHGFAFSPYPLIDETGLKGHLGHIEFEGNINDYTVLKKGLEKYNIQLEIKDRWIEVLVISEPPGYYFPLGK